MENENEKKEEQKNQEEQITQKYFCTNCGSEMDPNAAFCVSCGVSKGKIKKHCSHCGETVTEEQDYCVGCGNKLSTKLNFSKGKEAFQKVTQSTIESTTNLANTASEKTGKKIKPSWLIGGLGAVVLVIISIFMLMPKGLSGVYTQKTKFLGVESSTSIKFNGDKYEETKNADNKGTYKIEKNKISFFSKDGEESIDGTITDDRKSFKLWGMTFNKDEK
ncbi:zinc ribbon domain-containing protein [Vagococcus hydrophili]|uniref:Zinc-ribbon domain-containing protein n=1 Tax=Vagococcus hydrophili TaxID=2714947 RepID=A0A6G8ATQ7_9ENTE|nr:zinc ribbon domain-containing protein [Vagococcus hydrophili]QIL48360.1 zinc-ribbon domain-containing protein [Vagococcus hydrophili]